MSDPDESARDNDLVKLGLGQEKDNGSETEDKDLPDDADIDVIGDNDDDEMKEPESADTEEDSESEFAIIDKDPDLGFGDSITSPEISDIQEVHAGEDQVLDKVLQELEVQRGERAVCEETGDNIEEETEQGDNEFAIVGDNEDLVVDDEDSETESVPGDGDTLDRPMQDSGGQEFLDNVDIRQSVDAVLNAGSLRNRKAFLRQKAKRIEKVLSGSPVDEHEVRQLAINRGGLLNTELRRKAWPVLLNINIHNIPPKPDDSVLKDHKDYRQVELDVKRSDKRFPPGIQESHRMSLQDKMIEVIMRVLVRHPELHYYQGFHDIVVTILLVADEDLCFAIVEKLAIHHLRDFMEKTMERTQQLLDYVPPLIRRANPELLEHMEKAELGSVFCISWLLTWFGHVLGDIQSILRMFDFFIACHPLMPIYVMGSVVLYREKEILSTEADMPALYQLLTHIPDNLPIEHLLSTAGDLYIQYPPTELANEALRRFKRAQEEAAERRAQVRSRENAKKRKLSRYLPDGNSTFTKVTIFMLGAVMSVAAYALISAMGWDWTSWTRH